MSESAPETTHYDLTAADAERLQELSREVRGRLREIASSCVHPINLPRKLNEQSSTLASGGTYRLYPGPEMLQEVRRFTNRGVAS
jgi:hypothetical protein